MTEERRQRIHKIVAVGDKYRGGKVIKIDFTGYYS